MAGVLIRQQVTNELHHVVGKVIRAEIGAATKGPGCDVIGSWRSTESQVNATRVQGLQGGELLGHHERRVIGEHDAARAHPHRRSGGGQMLNENSGSGTRDGRDRVMLRDPKPVIPETLRFNGEHRRLPESLRRRRTAGDGREVKNGEGDHVRIYLRGGPIGSSPSKGTFVSSFTRRNVRDETGEPAFVDEGDGSRYGGVRSHVPRGAHEVCSVA